MSKRTWTYEQLTEAVKNNKTFQSVERALGLKIMVKAWSK